MEHIRLVDEIRLRRFKPDTISFFRRDGMLYKKSIYGSGSIIITTMPEYIGKFGDEPKDCELSKEYIAEVIKWLSE